MKLPNDIENIIYYKAISIYEPISKPLLKCKKKIVSFHLLSEEDKKIIKEGKVASLRKKRITEVCKEAFIQGALLTHEDLASLLCTSLSTIKRDIKILKEKGIIVPTRGFIKDIGKGESCKSKIVCLYKKGLEIKQIADQLCQKENTIKQIIEQYTKVIELHQKNIPLKNIQIVTKISSRVIKEFIKLKDG